MPTNREAMQQMWDATAKTEAAGGSKFIVFKNDAELQALYYNGVFYRPEHRVKEWTESFAACRQKDGAYKVSYADWMAKEKFYAGPIVEGWDPWTIRGGAWGEEELVELFRQKIEPQSTLTLKFLKNFLETAKQNGLLKGGKLVVDDSFKGALTQLINRHPSPPRRRWMEFVAYQLALEVVGNKLLAERSIATGTPGKPGAEARAAVATRTMARQADKLKSLEKVKTVEQALEKAETESVSLADLKKKRTKGAPKPV